MNQRLVPTGSCMILASYVVTSNDGFEKRTNANETAFDRVLLGINRSNIRRHAYACKYGKQPG